MSNPPTPGWIFAPRALRSPQPAPATCSRTALSYYNPLLGGSRRAPETMMIGWGEGLDEAARYLNARAGAAQLVVAASYRPAFAPFFEGTSASLPTEDELGQAPMDRALAADYVLTYANHWQRDLCRPLYPVLAGQAPEHSVWIDGLEYVRIYRMPPP